MDTSSKLYTTATGEVVDYDSLPEAEKNKLWSIFKQKSLASIKMSEASPPQAN